MYRVTPNLIDFFCCDALITYIHPIYHTYVYIHAVE